MSKEEVKVASKSTSDKDILYSYFLHYNPYTGYWCAVPRDKSIHYLNGTLTEDDVLKHKDVTTLVDGLLRLKK